LELLLSNGQAANNNTAIGVGTLIKPGTDNAALGYNAGLVITTELKILFLGSTSCSKWDESINNATAIGTLHQLIQVTQLGKLL
jgi:hypothetical protein